MSITSIPGGPSVKLKAEPGLRMTSRNYTAFGMHFYIFFADSSFCTLLRTNA